MTKHMIYKKRFGLCLLLGLLQILGNVEHIDGATDNLKDIRSILDSSNRHGMPYEYAAAMDRSSVDLLLGMLKDPNDESRWHEVMECLLIIRPAHAEKPLVAFFEKHMKLERMSADRFSAVRGALAVLGAIGTPSALNYVEPLILSNRLESEVSWKEAPTYRGREDMIRTARKWAILGLGYSEKNRARALLESLSEELPKRGLNAYAEMIDAALDINNRIKTYGREDVHRSQFDPGGLIPQELRRLNRNLRRQGRHEEAEKKFKEYDAWFIEKQRSTGRSSPELMKEYDELIKKRKEENRHGNDPK